MDDLMSFARTALLSRRSAIERTMRQRAVGARTPVTPRRKRSPAFTDAERRELGEIDAALEKIEKGSWGHCERCGTAIGRQRLRAVPDARHCEGCSGAG
jgi:DnaK suppressor protein